MPGVIVQSAANSTVALAVSSLTATIGLPLTAGNTIIGIVSCYYDGASNGGTPWTMDDDAGVSYTEDIHSGSGSFGGLSIFHRYNIGATGTLAVTVHLTAPSYPTLQIYEVSGLLTTDPIDQVAASGYVADPGSPWAFTSTNTSTTAQADEFLIGSVHFYDGSVTVTPGSGWTNPSLPLVGKTVNGANGDAQNTSYRNVSATGAYAYDGNFSASPTFSTTAAIATFKCAAAATDEQPMMRRWGGVPHMGGQGIGQKGGGGGRTWGRRKSGIIVPARFREAA